MLKKRSFTIARHRTSVALEPEFWRVLERLAATQGRSLARLVAEIDAAKTAGLASSLRVHALLGSVHADTKEKNGPRGAKPERPKSGESV
jgi:predicted DNA-binding ribbon-helix-helix protein